MTADASSLERLLARHARALNLDRRSLPEADEARVREFCEIVLTELAARGLIEGELEVGCYALPRQDGN